MGLPLGLVDADYIELSGFGLFHRLDINPGVVGRRHREPTPEFPGMFLRAERIERIVQRIGLADNIGLTIIPGMADYRVGKGVITPVLFVLICISGLGPRCMEQRQPEDIVRGLVPAVFAVVQDGDSVGFIRSRQVGPLLCENLVSRLRVVPPTYRTDSQIISRLGIGHRERKFGFQQGVRFPPIHFVADVDPVVLRSVGQRDDLYKAGFSVRFFHTQRCPYRTEFIDRDPHIAVDGCGRTVDRLFENLPGRPFVGFVLREEYQTDGFSVFYHFTGVTLVENRYDIALIVEADAVNTVLKTSGRGLQGAGDLAAAADLKDRIADWGHLCGKENFGHSSLVTLQLSLDPVSVRAIDRDPRRRFGHRNAGCNEVPA